METEPTQRGQGLPGSTCSPPYLAEETVGEIIRWIDREHMKAAKEDPPNRDYMRALQRLGKQVQDALTHYRKSKANANAQTPRREQTTNPIESNE